jgi:hypothetical protein
MIHFFHADIDGGATAKEQIVVEQVKAWLHLHELLRRWECHFTEFHDDIISANFAMKEHKKFLQAKFDALKSKIEGVRPVGHGSHVCRVCNFDAVIAKPEDDHFADLRCMVCDYTATQVTIDCPGCDEPFAMDEGYANCTACGFSIEPKHIADALTDACQQHHDYKNGEDIWQNANCDLCEGYKTVIGRADDYFCVQCFNVADRLEQCGYCGEDNTGDMEDSFYSGCGFCDGRFGNEKYN